MNSVDLDAVKTGPLGVVGRLAELPYNRLNLLSANLAAGLIQPAVWNWRGGNRRNISHIGGDRHTVQSRR